MKNVNRKQLHNIVENSVRKVLKENADAMDTVWKDSDELEHENPYDDMRISQEMNVDWDTSDKTKKNFNSTKNPVLSPHYNHNVEDGREEAEAYAEGLFEAKIQKMVRKYINEALDEPYDNKRTRRTFGDHEAYDDRVKTIEKIVRHTMKDVAMYVSKRMGECKADLYDEGVADSEPIVYQWEREIRKAIFSESLQKKFCNA